MTAGGFNAQGNMPPEDAMSAVAATLRDVASGLRPIASPLPTWNHRARVEQQHRAQAERAARQAEDRAVA